MKIVVVGGGVVGLCVAEALVRRDAEVTVLEAGGWGRGASEGNAGWVTPGISTPVPAPGVVAQALRWMADPASPLLVRPSLRPSFLRWAWRFCRSAAPGPYHRNLSALSALTARVLDDYDALEQRGVGFEQHRGGLLFVGRTAAAVEHELAALRAQQALFYSAAVERLDADAARRYEPQLRGELAGAVLAPAERHVRPESLVAGLVDRLTTVGADLRPGCAATALDRDGARWRVTTDDGDALLADHVVVAAGHHSDRLLRRHGVRLPLQGAKGYSLTFDGLETSVRGPIYLLEAKVAVAPYAGALRLAGTLELGRDDRRVSPRRVGAVERAGRDAIHALDGIPSPAAWAGHRPLLPDGLPVLGPVPGRPGLHLATGHAMLGVTLAATTGQLVAEAIVDDRPSPLLAPFTVARFGRAQSPATRSSSSSASREVPSSSRTSISSPIRRRR